MEIVFEWDESKARKNLAKHQVGFEEAETVFADRLAKINFDEEHSRTEVREIIVGHSDRNRLLVVSFTERGADVVRIISARLSTNYERQDYEENRDG